MVSVNTLNDDTTLSKTIKKAIGNVILQYACDLTIQIQMYKI